MGKVAAKKQKITAEKAQSTKKVEVEEQRTESEAELEDLEALSDDDLAEDDELNLDGVSSDESSAAEADSEEEESTDDFETELPLMKKKKNKDDGSAQFADALSAIVGSRLKAYDRKDPILARSKLTIKKFENDKLDAKAKRLISAEKKITLDIDRVKTLLPAADNEKAGEILAKERRLKKVAQRGVVKLFNAVLSTQVKTHTELGTQKIIGQTKKEEMMTEISKEKFLDLVQAAADKTKESEEAFDASLDLLRRLDPQNIQSNLNNICRVAPGLAEDLLSSIDTPLSALRDPTNGKAYLCCDYNRDGDSYRSPWSNEYHPAADADAPAPSRELRELEVFANASFDVYRDLYYEGGVSSVYLWDQGDGLESDGFAGVVLLKKDSDDSSSSWNSIHVVEVTPEGASATYAITSTIILDLHSAKTIDLSGNLVRQTEKTLATGDLSSHISNIGTLIEEIETKLRNMLQEVYFGKTRDILGDLRTTTQASALASEKQRVSEMVKGLSEL
ncbi:hypothetical protein BABINDRAFT_13490 [Babjeviella inositovora NRRL Y-12698]|uniref:F-actin-capping protein subunit beta n=1 Tax=Babjeviella inositovora NRRL Y-12698 TaxID=984486 RepID=A0A1E3QQA7_9ASCO|nr:uncharacterized protein BABINDRAFT_13490 [Babjeviella inositovora NRRL Y-12698]ODQ79889.1 hypothetical protein BABINDRAFT_13490 [Babjeviella inositovora NRRL Y-12698]